MHGRKFTEDLRWAAVRAQHYGLNPIATSALTGVSERQIQRIRDCYTQTGDVRMMHDQWPPAALVFLRPTTPTPPSSVITIFPSPAMPVVLDPATDVLPLTTSPEFPPAHSHWNRGMISQINSTSQSTRRILPHSPLCKSGSPVLIVTPHGVSMVMNTRSTATRSTSMGVTPGLGRSRTASALQTVWYFRGCSLSPSQLC